MDILALVLRRPKLDAAQRIANVHADTDDIVKEMLGIKISIKIRILAIRNISNGLNDDNAVQAEVEQRHTLLPRTKEEPPVAKYLQQIGKQDSKTDVP